LLCLAIFLYYKKRNFIAKRSKVEQSELNHKLESKEEKEDSPEVRFLSCQIILQISPNQLRMNSHPWNNLNSEEVPA
jgi:hypothetical protein